MIHRTFHHRWRIKMSHQGFYKKTQFIRLLRVMQYDFLYESSIIKSSVNHNYVFSCWIQWKFHKSCMWVINMTHLKYARKSEFSDRDFQIFAWAFQLKFKNVNLNEFEIKFPIEWYVYYAYFISRIRNIEDVLKIEHTQ